MNLLALPAFSDNYIWLLHDGHAAIVVDPGDATPVVQTLQARHLRLSAILVTHHHVDHIGGIETLRPYLNGPVFAPSDQHIPGVVTPVVNGEYLSLLGHTFHVLAVPGHTLDHLAFVQPPTATAPGRLFCGDTLFSAGCGRLFEGTPAQMFASLARLAQLPRETQVCCAHEYTLSNLHFAAAVEPKNHRIAAWIQQCTTLRETGQPTLPSNIGTELDVNPYLRCTEPDVIAAALHHGATDASPVAVFTALREWKNRFR